MDKQGPEEENEIYLRASELQNHSGVYVFIATDFFPYSLNDEFEIYNQKSGYFSGFGIPISYIAFATKVMSLHAHLQSIHERSGTKAWCVQRWVVGNKTHSKMPSLGGTGL